MNTTEYESLRAKIDSHKTAFDHPAPTNDERSAVEVFEFMRDKPAAYSVYVSSDEKTVTTWTGEILGHITYVGHPHTNNFGGGGNKCIFWVLTESTTRGGTTLTARPS